MSKEVHYYFEIGYKEAYGCCCYYTSEIPDVASSNAFCKEATVMVKTFYACPACSTVCELIRAF